MPSAVPARRAIRIAAAAGMPWIISSAQMIALNAKVDPTERSIPSDKITHVIPKAISPLKDACLSRFKKLLPVRNSGLTQLITMTSSTSAI